MADRQSLKNGAGNTTEMVTESLRSLILSGELAPGSRIRQEDLAERFAVSRIPVRGALSRLENDGLVTLKTNSGAWVAKLDIAECVEIYLIRERLEPLALLHAVPHFDDDAIDNLASLVDAASNAADTEEFLHFDREFHLASYRATSMTYLVSMIERFWNTTQQYRRAFITLLGTERNWVIDAEHRLIIDAIRRRDAKGAAHVLFEHIRRTRFELSRHKDLFETSPKPAKSRKRKTT